MAGSFTILQYQTDPPYQPGLLDDQGNKFVYSGYAPSNFSIELQRVTDNAFIKGTGSFSVDVINNLLAYQWNVNDVSLPGTWEIFLTIATLSGFKRRYLDTVIITPAPAP